jgi:hypothetical protein
MPKTFCLTLLVALLLSGCSDMGNPLVSPSVPEPQPESGKFVVDSFAVWYTTKINPNTDSVNAVFPFILKYHFEGYPGSISRLSIVTSAYDGMTIFADAVAPDSVNRCIIFSDEFWARNQYATLDSVLIQISVTGPFWNPTDSGPCFLGTFAWHVEVKIPIRGS